MEKKRRKRAKKEEKKGQACSLHRALNVFIASPLPERMGM
jgi:hypothetical protein